jgi:hypothetical protein
VVKAGIEIGAYMAVGYLLQAFALQTTDASRAALLSTFTVLTVPILAGLNGTKIRPLVWLCCLGSILGEPHAAPYSHDASARTLASGVACLACDWRLGCCVSDVSADWVA